jgi:hypothetical protein
MRALCFVRVRIHKIRADPPGWVIVVSKESYGGSLLGNCFMCSICRLAEWLVISVCLLRAASRVRARSLYFLTIARRCSSIVLAASARALITIHFTQNSSTSKNKGPSKTNIEIEEETLGVLETFGWGRFNPSSSFTKMNSETGVTVKRLMRTGITLKSPQGCRFSSLYFPG